MPRPKNKGELLYLGQLKHNKLMAYIEKFSEEEQSKDFDTNTLNRNIRDVLAHLHHWHLMILKWYEEGMAGKKPAMPAEGYTWRTVPELNIEINKRYQSTSLEEVKKLFRHSFQRVQGVIDQHDNDALFTKKKYKWTGTTSMGAYFISATSSHYEWAIKLIKKGLKLK